MQADIILVGQELLDGHIVDTNSVFLAQRLAETGFEIREKAVVGDGEEQIAAAVSRALEASPLVITSGGIGPTVDDRTRQACARATGLPLELNPELEDQIRSFHEKRGQEFGENSRRQAYIPRGAQPIPNPVGTAPCFVVRRDSSRLVVLPGVPRELKHLTDNFLIPFLHEEFGLKLVTLSRTLHTGGVGESLIDRKLNDLLDSDNPRMGLLASAGQVDIRMTAAAPGPEQARDILDQMEKRINDKLEGLIFGRDGVSLPQVTVELMQKRGASLALLETNTGGLLASRISGVAGGFGAMFWSAVCPLGQAPNRLAGNLDKADLAIDQDSALALARAVRQKTGADLGLAVLGDEDPEVGPFKEKVGQSFIALAGPDTERCRQVPQGGLSDYSRAWVVAAGLQLLRQSLA